MTNNLPEPSGNHGLGHRKTKGAAVYSAYEVADMLGVNLHRVYREARAGKIPCLIFGNRFIFPRAAVDGWLASAGGKVAA